MKVKGKKSYDFFEHLLETRKIFSLFFLDIPKGVAATGKPCWHLINPLWLAWTNSSMQRFRLVGYKNYLNNF